MSLMAFASPCEVIGLESVSDSVATPFIVVRTKIGEGQEKYILKTGEGVTWEVNLYHPLVSIDSFISEILSRNA